MSAAVIFRMGADSKGLKRDLEAAGQQVKRTTAKMGADMKANLAAGLTSGIVGAMSIGALTSAGAAILDFAGSLQDASDAMGISVEALQELQGAFAQSGAGAETVNKGLAKLSENLTLAKSGTDAGAKMVATFERLGVTWQDINTLAPDQVLMAIAASAKDAHDPAERLALIIDVLGKGGIKMAAGLNAGTDALLEARAAVMKLTAEEVAQLDTVGDAITRYGNKAKVAGAQLLLGKPPKWLEALQATGLTLPFLAMQKLFGTEAAVAGADAAGAKAAYGMSPKDEAALRSFEKEQFEEQKLITETAEWNFNQYREFTQRRSTEEQKRAEEDKEYGEDLLEEQRKQYVEFTGLKRKADEEAAEKKKKLAKDIADVEADGQKRLAELDQAAGKNKEERSKASLADMAANFRNTQGMQARQVERLEKRAAKFAGRDEDKAKALQQRADDLRKNIKGLKEADKGEDFKNALDKAKVLADIRDNVKNLRNAQ